MSSLFEKWRSFFAKACLDFLYPPLCLSCQEHLSSDLNLLCRSCLNEFAFSEREEYCRGCFFPFEDPLSPHCVRCLKNPSPFTRVLGVLEEKPSISALRQKLGTFPGAYLAEGMAALMAYQYLKEGGVWPDMVIGMPGNGSFFFSRDLSSSELLASQFASLLRLPCRSRAIKKKIWDSEFSLREGILAIEDKRILLVGDNLSSSFFKAGHLLLEGFPKEVYGLTFSFSPRV